MSEQTNAAERYLQLNDAATLALDKATNSTDDEAKQKSIMEFIFANKAAFDAIGSLCGLVSTENPAKLIFCKGPPKRYLVVELIEPNSKRPSDRISILCFDENGNTFRWNQVKE
jgi:hypothetical protein